MSPGILANTERREEFKKKNLKVGTIAKSLKTTNPDYSLIHLSIKYSQNHVQCSVTKRNYMVSLSSGSSNLVRQKTQTIKQRAI